MCACHIVYDNRCLFVEKKELLHLYQQLKSCISEGTLAKHAHSCLSFTQFLFQLEAAQFNDRLLLWDLISSVGAARIHLKSVFSITFLLQIHAAVLSNVSQRPSSFTFIIPRYNK